MIFKHKIKSILTHIPLLLLALVCTLTINSIQAYALDAATEKAVIKGVKANLMGVSNSGHTTTGIPEGVSWANTGYLCYMYTKEGSPVPGTDAKLLKCSTFAEKPGNTIKVISKNGDFTRDRFDDVCPWPYTPFNEDTSSNQAKIKEWMVQKIDGVQNAIIFVKDKWGDDVKEKFKSGEYVLVVENVLHFQYSKEADGTKTEPPKANADDVRAMLKKIVGLNEYNQMLREDKESLEAAIASLMMQINGEIAEEWYKIAPASTGYQLLGSPVTGTCSDLLEYFNNYISQHTSVNLFSRYTRNISCFAEMLQENEAGFTQYTGSTASTIRLSDGEIKSKGVSMFIISAENDSIDTYSPPEGSPGKPEDPSTNPGKQGECTIIKGYYTENETTGTKVSDGVHFRKEVTNNINILDEPEYKVVQWDISTTENTGLDPTAWNPPASTEKGETPCSIELEGEEKVVYVLLKRVEQIEPEEAENTYILSEARLSRAVETVNPDKGTDLLATAFKISLGDLKSSHAYDCGQCYPDEKSV